MKILVVEDNEISKHLIKKLIEEYGEKNVSHGIPNELLLKAPECKPIAMRDHDWFRKFDKLKKNKNKKL